MSVTRITVCILFISFFFTASGCGLKTRSVSQYEDGQYVGQQTEAYFDGNEFAEDFFSMLVGVGVGAVTYNAMGGDWDSGDVFSKEWIVSNAAGGAAAEITYGALEAAEKNGRSKAEQD